MSCSAFEWEILPGLPPYGNPALPFSNTGQGIHCEGLVVRFRLAQGDSWTGNFQRGYGECETVLEHPNLHDVVVVAGGIAYVVNPKEKRLLGTFGGNLELAVHMPSVGFIIIGNGLWFESLPAHGVGWKTRRISWDGMKGVHPVNDTRLEGEAYSPIDCDWHAFSVDLTNGAVTGGSYNGPPM